MGAYQLIMLAILFIIVMFWFHILRLLAWPLNIGFPSLSPTPLTSMIWSIIMIILNFIFKFIIIVCIVLYFVWRVLQVIPLIGWIVDYITPFKELRETGVFGLIEGLLGIVLSGFSKGAFQNMRGALRNFFKGSQAYARNAIGARTNKLRNRMPPPNERYSEGDYASNPNPAARGMDTRAQSSGGDGIRSKFTPSELAEIDDQYLKCVMENTEPVSSTDGIGKRLSGNLKNSNSKITCKMSMFKTYFDILSHKGADVYK